MVQGPHCTGKTVRGNTGNLEILPNTWKIQGDLFAQVVDSVLLKIQDITIFAAYFSNHLKSVSHMKLSKISSIGTGKISRQQRKNREVANRI